MPGEFFFLVQGTHVSTVKLETTSLKFLQFSKLFIKFYIAGRTQVIRSQGFEIKVSEDRQ